eukprot:9475611-Alexandrium_andersonii.AAC.1
MVSKSGPKYGGECLGMCGLARCLRAWGFWTLGLRAEGLGLSVSRQWIWAWALGLGGWARMSVRPPL